MKIETCPQRLSVLQYLIEYDGILCELFTGYEKGERSIVDYESYPRRAPQDSAERAPRPKKKASPNKSLIIRTIVLIVVLTAVMFMGIFAYYVKHVLSNDLIVDTDFTQKLTSTIMYQDDNGEWQELQKLFGTENRKLVDIEDLPDYVWQAAVSIEDQRFFKHHGVDWPRTIKATLTVIFTGDSSFGGSTLTQQLIKNITNDKQDTIKRKVTEIFRALELEKRYDKMEILEEYLNTVYFGSSSYGIGAAAETYFGKEASELTLAEAACIVGITNNPSMYNPLNDNDWSRDANTKRQHIILDKMKQLGYITKEECEAAKAEELCFVKDDETEAEEETASTSVVYSYFVDQVIADVIADLRDKYGYSYETAQSLLFNGGYTIYSTCKLDIQEAAEEVFEDLDNTPYISSATGKQMQAAMTIVDPYTGNVVAMVGGVGEKLISRGQNLATVCRPCGSSIKPISTYAPAIEQGVITVGSIIDDAPVHELNENPWPKNYDSTYSGRCTIAKALEESLNTCAVRVNEMLSAESSYLFMKEKLGFTTLVSDDINAASLALGGLTRGVTTEEMAAAYSAFVNSGIYTTPRTYSLVEDRNGNAILENNSESRVAMSETTAYYMDQLLQGVVNNGNAGGAKLSNVPVAGKTGTTTDNYDRYFVGCTPYYVGAVWCGYEYNESIRTGGTNPAVSLWKKVMSKVHSDLPGKSFPATITEETVTVELCLDSGMLATDACRSDVRGCRTQTVTIPAAYAPAEECTMHVSGAYCTEGHCAATASCPSASVVYGSMLDYSREAYGAYVEDEGYLIDYVPAEGEAGICPVHGNGGTAAEPQDTDTGADDEFIDIVN